MVCKCASEINLHVHDKQDSFYDSVVHQVLRPMNPNVLYLHDKIKGGAGARRARKIERV